mmetsp:Transcript_106632/g.329419  ORF Transcript_106632/g.329419 Transcript_106632/m.329419 type:complete len:206 (-) Transcript_106632:7-624(-)
MAAGPAIRRDEVHICRRAVLQTALPGIHHRVGDERPWHGTPVLHRELRVPLDELREDPSIGICGLGVVLTPVRQVLITATQQVVPHLGDDLHRGHIPRDTPVSVEALHLETCRLDDEIWPGPPTPEFLDEVLGPPAPVVGLLEETALQIQEGLQKCSQHTPIPGVDAAGVEACGRRPHHSHVTCSDRAPDPLIGPPTHYVHHHHF